MDYDFSYVSFGAGVQSTALLVLSCLGERGVPRADMAIFADTGDEPPHIYEYLDIVRDWASGHGVEVQTCSQGKLSEDILTAEKFAIPVPMYMRNDKGRESMLWRTCTRHYKIDPIIQHVRRHLGYKKGQRVKHRVQQMLGISTDEASRMKPAKPKWLTNTWPLVEANLHRDQCRQIVVEAGLPMPGKSACVYCPYRNDKSWQELKAQDPESFDQACDFEDKVNNRIQSTDNRFTGLTYLHRSLKPLREVDFTDDQGELFDNECEGHCGL